MKKLLNKVKRLWAIWIAYLAYSISTIQAYASGGGDSGNNIIVTGTKLLLKDALSLLQVMALIVGVLVIVMFLIKIKLALSEEDGDPHKATTYKKSIKTVLIVMIVVELIGQILKTIFSYYGISFDA